MEGVEIACSGWNFRHEHSAPPDNEEAIRRAIESANELMVVVYDIHPFRDGNTRAAWHLRNLALMLDGLPYLDNVFDFEPYVEAWGAAAPMDHQQLDDVVLEELAERL